MSEQKQKTVVIELLRDAEGQFFNIPPEFEFLSNEVILKQEDNRLVMTPVKPTTQADENQTLAETKTLTAQKTKNNEGDTAFNPKAFEREFDQAQQAKHPRPARD